MEERPAEGMYTKLRSVIHLTEGTEEDLVVLTNDHSTEGVASTNDTVPEMPREYLEVVKAERKAFTDALTPDFL